MTFLDLVRNIQGAKARKLQLSGFNLGFLFNCLHTANDYRKIKVYLEINNLVCLFRHGIIVSFEFCWICLQQMRNTSSREVIIERGSVKIFLVLYRYCVYLFPICLLACLPIYDTACTIFLSIYLCLSVCLSIYRALLHVSLEFSNDKENIFTTEIRGTSAKCENLGGS